MFEHDPAILDPTKLVERLESLQKSLLEGIETAEFAGGLYAEMQFVKRINVSSPDQLCRPGVWTASGNLVNVLRSAVACVEDFRHKLIVQGRCDAARGDRRAAGGDVMFASPRG
jgi:hypothetical protein